MLKASFNTKDEEELKNLMNNLAPYLRNKTRPILFMARNKDTIKEETQVAINKMLSELKTTPKSTEKTSEVSVSGDTMQVEETNVTINIDDDPFSKLDQTDIVLDHMKFIEEENKKIEEERLQIEEAKQKLVEEEWKLKEEEEKRKEEEIKRKEEE